MARARDFSCVHSTSKPFPDIELSRTHGAVINIRHKREIPTVSLGAALSILSHPQTTNPWFRYLGRHHPNAPSTPAALVTVPVDRSPKPCSAGT